MDKILQLLPCDGTYFVAVDTQTAGPYKSNRIKNFKIVCWALVEREGITLVVPMVLGDRALIFMGEYSSWSIQRVVN